MGKLVLYLADGTTLDIRLARERITIGRRADNDVCLPYPAVSGEHAAVVTILSDSFLEDLGSTNGSQLDGSRLSPNQPMPFGPGAVLSFGNSTLTLPTGGAPAEATIVTPISNVEVGSAPDAVSEH